MTHTTSIWQDDEKSNSPYFFQEKFFKGLTLPTSHFSNIEMCSKQNDSKAALKATDQRQSKPCPNQEDSNKN